MKRDKGKAMKMKAFFSHSFLGWNNNNRLKLSLESPQALNQAGRAPLNPMGLGHTGAAPRLIVISLSPLGTSK